MSSELQNIFRNSAQPFLISYMKYDPVTEIKKLEVPVLIIQGTTDLQVTAEDAQRLKEACKGSKLVIIEDMNHVLKEVSADVNQNMATYSDPDLPLADNLLEEIVAFIKTKE